MAEPLADRVIKRIGQAAELYHRLVMLVAPAGCGKTAALQDVHERTAAPLINVNLELSRRLLDLTSRQRALQLPRLLAEIVSASAADMVLSDNIEVLFDVSLKQDPLRLLPAQIVSWLKQSSQLRELISAEVRSAKSEIEESGALRTTHLALLREAKDRWYVPDPNKAGDLEKMRERSLLKEFEEYRTSSQRRLKVFRLEAVRAGFKKAWQERDYATIITVARKIPENVLQEDPKLLMWYDQALTRQGGESLC